MKKEDLKKLALLGLAAGALFATESAIHADGDDDYHIDLDYVLAKPSCKAHGGCGGLTASRDIYNADKEEAEEAEAQDADDAKAKKPAPKSNANSIKKSV
jgi:hypothetical protein